jgi:aminoglycoside phosphotransferase
LGLGVRAEGEVLRHLNRLDFPAPLLEQASKDHLITRRLPGTSLRSDFRREHSQRVMETLADWFARLHQLEAPRELPDRGVQAELAEARLRIKLGLVDTERVVKLPGRPTPLQLWQQLRATTPGPGKDCLTHGDPWPCNLFFEGTIGRGIIDWARAGVGAVERDLAVLDRALTHHYGPDCRDLFWTKYGPRPLHLPWFEHLSYLF